MAFGGTVIGRGVIPVVIDRTGVDSGLAGIAATSKTKLGAAGKVAGAALATGIAAAVGGGTALFQIGATFDRMTDSIIQGTGASGKALRGLERDALAVGKTTPSSFDDIGVAIAGLNTRLGLTGKPLRDVASNMLNLSRMTGTDLKTNIKEITRLFGDWSIPTNKQADTLDKLFRASQATGIEVSDLSNLMVRFGSPLRQLGLGFDFTAAMFSRFEQEGVNIQTAMPGLRMALKNFAADGREPAEALKETFHAIRNTASTAKANTIAFEVFGTRAGPDLAAAIREGRFDLGELIGTIRNSKGALEDADKRTRDFGESWQLLKNRVMVPLRPIAVALFDAIGLGVERLADAAGPAFQQIGRGLERFRSLFSGGGSLGSGLQKFGQIVSAVFSGLIRYAQRVWTAVAPGLGDLGALIRDDLIPAFQSTLPVLRPIASFVIKVIGSAVIGALKGAIQFLKGVVQIITGIFKVFGAVIRGDWKGVWEGLKDIAKGIWNAIVGAIRVWLNVGILAFLRGGLVRIVGVWKGGWKAVGSAFQAAWRWIVGLLKTGWSLFTQVFRNGWGVVFRLWTGAFKTMQTTARVLWRGILGVFRGAWQALKSGFDNAVSAVARIWGGIQRAAAAPVNFVINTVWNNGLRKVIGAIPGVSTPAAIGSISSGRPASVSGTHFTRMARGGPVFGGVPGRDSVPALLMPDEHVLTAAEVRAAGGHQRIKAWREAIRRRQGIGLWAKGGPVWPTTFRSLSPQYPGHTGIDISIPGSADYGKPVFATQAGMARYVNYGNSSYGKSVWIDHGALTTIYAHLSRVGKMGRVNRGQTIGAIGSTGNSTGPHLHFEVRPGATPAAALAYLRGSTFVGGKGSADVMSPFTEALKLIKSTWGKVSGWMSSLSGMGAWGGLIRSAASSIVGNVKSWLLGKLPAGAGSVFDRGGIWRGGVGFNTSGRPERVLSPQQTIAFEQLLRGRRYGWSSTATEADPRAMGTRVEITGPITTTDVNKLAERLTVLEQRALIVSAMGG